MVLFRSWGSKEVQQAASSLYTHMYYLHNAPYVTHKHMTHITYTIHTRCVTYTTCARHHTGQGIKHALILDLMRVVLT